jgi:hypothetical protein
MKLLYSCVILCSIFACQKVTIKRTYNKISCTRGPEDIVLDKANHRILISCNEYRDNMPKHGEIQQLDLISAQCSTLPLVGMPPIPFHPHGFDMQTINGINYLYVINHYSDGSKTSSVLKFKINASNLEFEKEFKNSLLISPNDLTVLPNGSFYFSNDRNSLDVLELLTNPYAGSVVYCDGDNTWKKVDSAIAFPNGMYNENNTLYVATSRNHALFTYTIQPDGSLSNRKTLSKINGMDNISDNGDELIVAVHADEIKFALLAYIPSTKSPCKTFSINKKTGAAKLIFSDDGSMISGSSTALVVGKDLYLSQVFEGFILKITHYDD